MPSPTVSIVIPSYNRPHFLPRAVVSALQECPADGEVIVVDDNSSAPAAGSLRVVSDARLRVIRNAGQPGASGARNHGVAAATGQLVFFLDDDDEFVHGYVDDVVRRVREGSAADYGFSYAVKFSTRHVLMVPPRRPVPEGVLPSTTPFRYQIAATSSGFWVRRDSFLALGGFDTSQTVDEDTDLCVRYILAGHKALFSRRFGTIRHLDHTSAGASGSQLSQDLAADRRANCYLRTFAKASAAIETNGNARRYLAARCIRGLAKANRMGEAMRFARQQRPAGFALAMIAYASFCAVAVRRTK